MNKEVKIRGWNAGDEKKIIELLDIVFNNWPHLDLECSKMDHFNWKFSNPLSRETTALATDGDRIVGTFLTTFCHLKLGNTTYLTSNGCDVAVHPDYRGLGLFNKTRDYTNAQRVVYGVKTHLGRSGNQIVSEKYNRETQTNPSLTLKIPFALNWMARILDANEYSKKNPSRGRAEEDALIKMLGSRDKPEGKKPHLPKKNVRKLELKQVNIFDDTTDEFWNNIKDHYNFIIERKQEYMNWRFIDPRAGKFRVTLAEEDGKVVGYSILRVNRYEPENVKGNIADVLASPNRLDVVDSLLNEVVNYFDDQNINMSRCYCFENHPYQRIYQKYGFVPYMKEGYYLLLTEDLGKPTDTLQKTSVKKTYTSFGDEDSI